MSDDRQGFTVTSTDDGKFALAGDLDASTVRDLDKALATRNGALDVALDLSGLTFIDSSGLHAIVAYTQSREPEGTVTLRGVSPHILRLLEITHIDQLPKLRIDA